MALSTHDGLGLMAGLHQTLLALSRANKLDTATFMHHALYHPSEGYYTAQPHIWGNKGDYITAPDMTQVFGEMIALWVMQEWQQAGCPNAVHLVELGPGRYTLLRDMLRTFSAMPDFQKALEAIHLLDVRSPLQHLQTMDPRIQTHTQIQNIPHDESAAYWIISNEFFDALPIQQHLPDGSLQHVDTGNHGWAFRHPTHQVKEICPNACMWIQEFKRLLGRNGGMLAVDYGHTYGGYGHSTLQALYQHRYVSCFTHVGKADLTCHVNWQYWLEVAGGKSQLIPQGDWLLSMGAEVRTAQLAKKGTSSESTSLWTALARLTSPQHMGKLFSVWLWKPDHANKA